MIGRKNLSNFENFEGFHESKMKKIKGLTELSLELSLFLWSLSLIAKAILLIFPTANDSPNLAQRLLTVFFYLEKHNKFFLEKRYAGACPNIQQKPWA